MLSYTKSAQFLERSKNVLAGGVSSEFRKYSYPHALFYSHGKGSRLYDVDGNEYIDFTLSQGPLILGHSHPHVLQRVKAYSEKGQLYAGQHLLEVELAEKMQKYIPSAELIRFCLDGSTAIHTALRLARAKTGRNKFIRFEGHYHGWLDNVAWGISIPTGEDLGARENPNVFPWTMGLPDGVREEFLVLPWNDLDLVKNTVAESRSEIAAIITEPIMCNNGCILPEDGYLAGLREICDQHGIALIFDEVITGFRTSLGGAQSYFGITPDLSIFAKAMASGYPISAIVGKKDWMNLLATGEVIHAGTMNSACSLVAAALATIEVLEEEGTYERIFGLGTTLIKGLKELAEETDQNLLVQGLGPVLNTSFSSLEQARDFRDVQTFDKEKLGRFIAGLHDRGVRVIGRGVWYISAVHTDQDVEHALEAAEKVLKSL